MTVGAPLSFGAQLKALREAAGFTQEELATIAGLSVHAVSALERGERRQPQPETVRALCTALDLTGAARDTLVTSARAPRHATAVEELSPALLPRPLTALLGRDADVRTLRQWLADPAARLITLVGPGGVGKTRLALELARAIADEGTHRVAFAPLASVKDSGLAACAIAEALGLADISAPDLPKRARAACAGHPTLLVLDNLEQVPDVAPLAAALLSSAATLQLLATSRAPLRVRGEREYHVGPLAMTEPTASPADLTRDPAVRLFVERVRDVRRDFRLTSANMPTVAAICRRLDALPLALELAAPWMKVLTAEDLLRRLNEDVLLSAARPGDLPERQQTMNATVAWSYQLLSPNEQRAFRRLGVLPARFSADAAAAVVAGQQESSTAREETLAALAGLIDKSLLQRVEGAAATRPLYQMLETVRAYASRALTTAGERDDAIDGLVHYCTVEASRAAVELVGLAQVEWLERVHDDLDNYRDALLWLIERGRATETSDVATGLLTFWFIRGHAAEGLWWYEEALKLAPLTPAAEVRALLGAAFMQYTQRDFERARSGADRALALARRHGDVGPIAMASILMGHIDCSVGDVRAAHDRFTQSLEAFGALAMPWGAGNALTGLAGVALADGDTRRAENLLDQATVALRQAGPWYLTLVLYLRAVLAVRRGDADRAIAFVRESLTRIREVHDKFAFVHALVPLAAAAVLKGDDAWAARILGARDEVTERTGATVVDLSVRELQHEAERRARARLGDTRWAVAYEAGRGASIDELLKNIDAVLPAHPSVG